MPQNEMSVITDSPSRRIQLNSQFFTKYSYLLLTTATYWFEQHEGEQWQCKKNKKKDLNAGM